MGLAVTSTIMVAIMFVVMGGIWAAGGIVGRGRK